jgi:hypothetical protein
MPAKKANKAKQWQDNNVEFVNIRLNNKQKETFKSWFADNERELPNLLAVFLAAGYKMSLKYDADHECYIASATCFDDSMENHNKCLTSRSQDWLEAMALNLYKTDVLSEDGIWESSSTGSDWG